MDIFKNKRASDDSEMTEILGSNSSVEPGTPYIDS